MHSNTSDVLIAGAGPAGLASAIAAARLGLRVEVLDAARPPIDKACGEGLMPDSLRSLAALGINIRHHQTAPFHGIRFLNERPTATAQAIFPTEPGRGIRRTVLHQLLLDHALSLGVRFHWENPLRDITPTATGSVVRTTRQTLRARYLIGADGPRSRVAAAANLTAATVRSQRIGLRQHYSIAPWSNLVEVYWSDYGQAYVTPTSTNEVCVAFIARQKIPSPTHALQHFPTLSRHLASALPSDAPRGSITLDRTLRRVATSNIALTGDASGSVDAVTGSGLALCFRQAAALASALQAEDLSLYQQAHSSIRLGPQLISRSLLLLDQSPRLRARTLQTFERLPFLFQRLLEVHIGHRACIFPGVDDLLASGLHLMTN